MTPQLHRSASWPYFFRSTCSASWPVREKGQCLQDGWAEHAAALTQSRQQELDELHRLGNDSGAAAFVSAMSASCNSLGHSIDMQLARRCRGACLRSHVVGRAHHVCECLPWLVEDRQAEVCRLQRRGLGLVRQQEVLRLQVSACKLILIAAV